MEANKFKGKIINVEHHVSHIASSYYNSPYKKSVGLTIDGFGDFCSSQTFLCNDSKIESLKKVYFPHSLGILYQSITQFLGFKNYGDEYKVMGLASYGNPSYLDQFDKLIKYYFFSEIEIITRYFYKVNTFIKVKIIELTYFARFNTAFYFNSLYIKYFIGII